MGLDLKPLAGAALLLLALPIDTAAAVDAPGGRFVQQYIWDIGAFEAVREKALTETNTNANQEIASCIRTGMRFQLELDSASRRMRAIKLPGVMKETPGLIASTYEQRSQLYRELTDTCVAFMANPKPGTDYGAMAANGPKINAKLDFNAKSLFEGSALIAAALIDQTPDAQGKLSHIVLTRREKNELLQSISSLFGKSIDEKNQTYLIASVQLIRRWLTTSGHKCADE